MSNTLTALANTLYSSAHMISQEDAGFLSAVRKDFDDKNASTGDTIKIPYAPSASVSTFTPAMTRTAGTDKTANTVSVTLDTNDETSFNLTGDEERQLQNAGSDKEWFNQLVQEGMRALRNTHESSLFTTVYQGASGASGTAGTNPFASSIDALADVRKLMKRNGCKMLDVSCVMSGTSEANLLKLDLIQKANEWGDKNARETGVLGKFFGIKLRASEQISTHTKGTGTNSYQTVAGGEAVGQTTISVDTGSGTILAGDVVTHASDTVYKYVVNTALSGGDFVIGRPGLITASAENDAWTVGNNYTPQCCFERGAVVTVQRPPDIPESAIIEKMLISDTSGYTYLLCKTIGYGMVTYVLHSLWGNKVVNPQFVHNLMG